MKLFIFLVLMVSILFSWDGYSYEKGAYIEIQTYDHKGIGEGPIEYYDYSDGKYKTGYLDMYPGKDGTIRDDQSGESLLFMNGLIPKSYTILFIFP